MRTSYHKSLKLDQSVRKSQVSAYPIDNAGNPRKSTPVEVSVNDNELTLQFKPEHKSILYLVYVK